MSDLPVFMLVNLEITDPEAYRVYEKGFFPLLKKFGGEFVTFDDKPTTFEGDRPLDGRVIIFKFPSEAKAQEWYADAEYQALAEHRKEGTKLNYLTLVRTLPPRG